MDALTLTCPFCGTQHTDDLECLALGQPDFLRCENPSCSMSFVFLIHECPACAEESLFTWKEMPNAAALAALVCQHCAESLSDAPWQADSENPPQRI